MKKLLLLIAILAASASSIEAKDLVVYFSATGNTKAVAEEIAKQTGADLLRIEAAEPYAANPYNDSQRIQDEAYNDKRPGVANLPSAEAISAYDRIFVGSPIWWHQPAMVMCTFLESYDLSSKTIVPFFTYGATTYLNEAMHKIYKVTPKSRHIPAALPEDLNPDDITTPGPDDDSGIDMPGNARGVKAWLERLGLLGSDTSVGDILSNAGAAPYSLQIVGDEVRINLPNDSTNSQVAVYRTDGTLLSQMTGAENYAFQLPRHSVYVLSITDSVNGKTYSEKVAL